jgi:hypothetical protein
MDSWKITRLIGSRCKLRKKYRDVFLKLKYEFSFGRVIMNIDNVHCKPRSTNNPRLCISHCIGLRDVFVSCLQLPVICTNRFILIHSDFLVFYLRMTHPIPFRTRK